MSTITKSSTISQILEDCLLVDESSSSELIPKGETASKLLLAENESKRNREKEKLEDIIKFNTKPPSLTPLLDQIVLSNALENAEESRIKNIQYKQGHKKKIVLKEKGTSYKDKLDEKFVSKNKRKERLQQFAKLY